MESARVAGQQQQKHDLHLSYALCSFRDISSEKQGTVMHSPDKGKVLKGMFHGDSARVTVQSLVTCWRPGVSTYTVLPAETACLPMGELTRVNSFAQLSGEL